MDNDQKQKKQDEGMTHQDKKTMRQDTSMRRETEPSAKKQHVFAPTHQQPFDEKAPPESEQIKQKKKKRQLSGRSEKDESAQSKKKAAARRKKVMDAHGTDAVPEKQASGRRKRKRSKRGWKVFLAVLCLIGVLVCAYFALLIKEVRVEGVQRFAAEEVAALSGIEPGSHLLLANLNRARANIEQNPYFEVLALKRIFPDAIAIEISERQPMAVICCLDYDVVIDRKGHVLSIHQRGQAQNLLRVDGVFLTGFQVNDQLGNNQDFQIQTLLQILDALERYGLTSAFERLDMSNPLRIYFYAKEGITVLLGQSDGLDEKMQWIVDVLPALLDKQVQGGVLDVSAKGGAIYSPEQENDPQQTSNADNLNPEEDTP